jgi:transcriptional regulator with XRE-family HTH domain
MAEKNGKLKRHNGATIRAFRIKDGKKPGQFASECLISYSTLDNIENERKEASLEVLYRIAGVLNVPVEAIVRDPASLVTGVTREPESVSA